MANDWKTYLRKLADAEGVVIENDEDLRRFEQERRKEGDKTDSLKDVFHGNRQRMPRPKGRNLQKRRSEVVESGLAHICKTGGAPRTWLRGLANVRKRDLIAVAAHNLGIVSVASSAAVNLEPLVQPPGFCVFAVFTSFRSHPGSLCLQRSLTVSADFRNVSPHHFLDP